MTKESELFEELKQKIKTAKNVQEVKDFVLQRFNEFPKDFQQEMAFYFFNQDLDQLIDQKLEEYKTKSRGFEELIKAILIRAGQDQEGDQTEDQTKQSDSDQDKPDDYLGY
ncbi:MAG: hypothetical protein GF332_03690 [Candidatus Moranbacteria bacterium]|nr:hypothetical protein [Candidatus Moranbacteria bacterium]